MSDCPECDYEQRTGKPVPDGVVHTCDPLAQPKTETANSVLEPPYNLKDALKHRSATKPPAHLGIEPKIK